VIDFFLRRPVFATVCSLVILLLGIVSIPSLPIAQYPNIAPPTVTVTSTYVGADAPGRLDDHLHVRSQPRPRSSGQ
jgi:HAE1 family hydrophobic/amphiphilic exporter-1